MVTVASEMLLPEVRQLCPWEREASEVSHVPVCGGWARGHGHPRAHAGTHPLNQTWSFYLGAVPERSVRSRIWNIDGFN